MTLPRLIGYELSGTVEHRICGQLISADGFLHHRRRFEYHVLIAVTEGVLYITANEIPYQVAAGQYILLAADEEHYGFHPSEGKLSYMWTHFSAERANVQQYVFPEYGSITNSERFFFLFRQLMELEPEDNPLTRYMSDNTLSLILSELAREHCSNTVEYSVKLPQVISSISEWIKANYYKQFTVAQLGEMFGYQADYLSSLFKKTTGISIVRYTNRIRIRSAKNLLLNYRLSVKETAYSCGFSDEKYFMRLFREYEGITPTQFRNSLNKKG